MKGDDELVINEDVSQSNLALSDQEEQQENQQDLDTLLAQKAKITEDLNLINHNISKGQQL